MRAATPLTRERHRDPLLDIAQWLRATGASAPFAIIGTRGRHSLRHEPLPADASSAETTVDALVDEGIRTLVVNTDGGDEPALRAFVAVLTSRDAGRVAPPYRPGKDDTATWRVKVDTVAAMTWQQRDALQDLQNAPLAFGLPQIESTAALLLTAAHRSTPVVIAGLEACAAALYAQRLDRHVSSWLALAYPLDDGAYQAAMDRLGLPMLITSVVHDDLALAPIDLAIAHLTALTQVD